MTLMVIRSFQNKDVEVFFKKGRVPLRSGWANARSVVQRKLDMLHYAEDLKDLRNPPANRLESLSGNLKGYYSIRINDQWRVIFRWDSQAYDVQIVDYH